MCEHCLKHRTCIDFTYWKDKLLSRKDVPFAEMSTMYLTIMYATLDFAATLDRQLDEVDFAERSNYNINAQQIMNEMYNHFYYIKDSLLRDAFKTEKEYESFCAKIDRAHQVIEALAKDHTDSIA